ncbi:MAG: entericidin A/B family lipoprotein [Gallionella sp.]|nr:entericidin A/B family lipoprotein [Gallionella sp.]MDD4958065.1 entericidin A/B family lipoprotein [Gallionella sp.]
MKKISFVIIVIALITGCNTIEGLGKDIQKGGHKLEKAAK